MMAAEKKIKYMRLDKACERLGCGRKKMRKLAMDAGALFKVERMLLVDVEKLDLFIARYYGVVEDGSGF